MVEFAEQMKGGARLFFGDNTALTVYYKGSTKTMHGAIDWAIKLCDNAYIRGCLQQLKTCVTAKTVNDPLGFARCIDHLKFTDLIRVVDYDFTCLTLNNDIESSALFGAHINFVVKRDGNNRSGLYYVYKYDNIEPVTCIRCNQNYIVNHTCCERCIRCVRKKEKCVCTQAEIDQCIVDKSEARRLQSFNAGEGMKRSAKKAKRFNKSKWHTTHVMNKVESSNPTKETGIVVRCNYDLETVPEMGTEVFIPVCGVVIVDILFVDLDKTQYLADLDPELNETILDMIDKVADWTGLVKSEILTEENKQKILEHNLNYKPPDGWPERNLNYKPPDYGWPEHIIKLAGKFGGRMYSKTRRIEEFRNCRQETSVETKTDPGFLIAVFQDRIYELFKKGEILLLEWWNRGEMFLELPDEEDWEMSDVKNMRMAFQKLYALCDKLNIRRYVRVLSIGFNNSGFDETFLWPYRVYCTSNKYRYQCRGGRITSMAVVELEHKNIYEAFVMFEVWDAQRYLTQGSLRQNAKDTKIEIQKGDCPFDLVNEYYQEHPYDGEDDMDMFRLWCHKLFAIEPEPTEGMLKFAENYKEVFGEELELKEDALKTTFSFYHLITWYCAYDVILIILLLDKFQESIEKYSKEICGFNFNIYYTASLPSASNKLFIYSLPKLLEQNILTDTIWAPQRFYEYYCRESVYGGRSEIFVVGHVKTDDIRLPDINGMYGACMMGLFPVGDCLRGCSIGAIVDKFVEFFKRCKVKGFRKNWDSAYDEVAADCGYMIASVTAKPPEDRRKHHCLAPVPMQDKTGALIWSYEERIQVLNSIDMEILARDGWSLTIMEDHPIICWGPMSMQPVYRRFNEIWQSGKVESAAAGRKMDTKTCKLGSNAHYGRMLMNNDHCVLGIYGVSDTKPANRIFESVIPNPFGAEPAFSVFKEHIDMDNRSENGVQIHHGSAVLAYSRTMVFEIVNWCKNTNWIGKVLPEHREYNEVLASETDSFHAVGEWVERLPEKMFCAKAGCYNSEKKAFDVYIKYEEFETGEPVSHCKDALYLGKKLYFIPPPAEYKATKGKFASKGFAKEEITFEKLLQAMGDNEGNLGIDIESERFERNLPGMQCRGAVATVRSIVLKRVLQPRVRNKVINVKEFVNEYDCESVFRKYDLANNCLQLLNCDAKYKFVYLAPKRLPDCYVKHKSTIVTADLSKTTDLHKYEAELVEKPFAFSHKVCNKMGEAYKAAITPPSSDDETDPNDVIHMDKDSDDELVDDVTFEPFGMQPD